MKPHIKLEPSNSEPDCWYWSVIDSHGEVYVDGDGGDAREDAERKAALALAEYQEFSGDDE